MSESRMKPSKQGATVQLEMVPRGSASTSEGTAGRSRSLLSKSQSVPHEQHLSTSIDSHTERGHVQRAGTQEGLDRGRFTRVQSIREAIPRFVGLSTTESEEPREQDEWNNRRLNYIKRHFKLSTNVKKQYESTERQLGTSPAVYDARQSFGVPSSERSVEMRGRSDSMDLPRPRRDSVFRIIADNVNSVITKGKLTPSAVPSAKSRSLKTFRSSFQVDEDDEEGGGGGTVSPGTAPRGVLSSLTPMGVTSSHTPVTPSEKGKKASEKFKQTLTELPETDELETSDTVGAEARQSPPSTCPFHLPRPSLLPMDRAPPLRRQSSLVDEVFFDVVTPLPPGTAPSPPPLPTAPPPPPMAGPARFIGGRDVSRRRNELAALDIGSSAFNRPHSGPVNLGLRLAPQSEELPRRPPALREQRPRLKRQKRREHGVGVDHLIATVSSLIANSDQHRLRQGGEGALGRLLGREMKAERQDVPASMARKLSKTVNERPLFTYWVTSVQVVVCLLSLLLFSRGPFSFSRSHSTGQVLSLDETFITVGVYEPGNIWFGPKFSDLIRLGAKYSPCMRREKKIMNQLELDRRAEQNTGCCVSSSRGSCYQAGQGSCPSANSILYRHKDRNFHRSQSLPDLTHLSSLTKSSPSSEVVCGHHPDFCEYPPSFPPNEWSKDITKWPACQRQRSLSAAPRYMTCPIVGRPCCIHLQGRCRIATEQYCAFVGGVYFHNKTLCSQVDCLGSVCGMLPFLESGHPNQFYRLFLSLFVHAGVLHLLLTLFIQWVFMRDLELYIGWMRMAIIYCVAGVGGNLASAIFVPFSPEVGPSGSQAGIVGALVVDVYYNADKIERPAVAYAQTTGWIFILLLTGIVPWTDNWAHLFGVIFGILTALIVFPDAGSSSGRRRQRVLIFCVALTISVLIFLGLGYIFFANIEMECSWCGYFNCVNLYKIFDFYGESESESDHFCDNQGLRLDSWLPI